MGVTGCELSGGLAMPEADEQAKILSSPRSNGQSLRELEQDTA